MATSSPGGQTNIGLAPNLGGLLCYLPCGLGLVFSIVVAIVEKQSRFLRYHAFHSLLTHASLIVLLLALTVLQIITAFMVGFLAVMVGLLWWAVSLAGLGLLIFMMVKAYNNEKQPLPVIGELAEKWAAM